MSARRLTGWSWWGAVRDGLTLAGLIYILGVLTGIVPYADPVPDYGPMFDARGFWEAWDGGLYDIPWGEYEAYVYSPAFAQILWPFTFLPWPVFAALWTAASIGCLFWMRVPWMLAFPGVIDDILRGNIHVFLAAMVVVGFRYSGAYAFGILTKVTPGIGLLWFAVRREWRPLVWALGVTGADRGRLLRAFARALVRVVRPPGGLGWRRRSDPGRSRCRSWCDSRSLRPSSCIGGLTQPSLAGAHRRHGRPAERVDLVDRAPGSGPGAVGMAADSPARGPCRLPRWSSGRLTPR